jgi:signal transduction histidine kinase
MFGKIIQDETKTPSKASIMMPQLLERIITLSQESVVSIRDIIWAIDPKTETMHDLLIRVRDMIISSCRAKEITLNYDLPNKELLPSKNLSPEQRRDLWMLMKEALSNSVKHSGCTELYVITLYDGEHIKIVIKDNGKGFNTSVNYNGKGLGTMKKRASYLGAILEFSSEPGKGTTIILNMRF